MQRPSCNTRCYADRYASPNERIVEVNSPHGGCLISLLQTEGSLIIRVYRPDPGISVFVTGTDGNDLSFATT